MPCFNPLIGYRVPGGQIKFNSHAPGGQLTVSCGICIGCRAEIKREWAVRAMHEVQMDEKAAFLTLTYSDDNIPENHQLKKKIGKTLQNAYDIA